MRFSFVRRFFEALSLGSALAFSSCVPTDATQPAGSDGGGGPPALKEAPGARNRPQARPIVGQPLGLRGLDGAAQMGTPGAPQPRLPGVPGVAPMTSGAVGASARAMPVPSASAVGQSARSAAATNVTVVVGPPAPITKEFHDFFERSEIGPDWQTTSAVWHIERGRLCGRGAHNHPIWLARKLPINARIEFDASSASTEGDLKVELWGDGKSFAKGTSYNDATSYIAIFGGWKNQFHVLARIDEHAPNRPEVKIDAAGNDLRARPVVANQNYHFKIERNDGKTVRWLVDDIEILSLTDASPLKGEGHDHLGFNNWEVPVCFDNLVIVSLEGS